MINKQLAFLALAGIILASVGLYGAVSVYAEEITDYPIIIQRLVERFNLDPAEVQDVFTGVREEKKAEWQASFEEKLNQAAAEGKITEEQKQAILEQKAEMQERQEELKDLSPEERKEAMKEFHEEMKTWAEENGITLKGLFGLGIMGKGGCMKGAGFHRSFKPW